MFNVSFSVILYCLTKPDVLFSIDNDTFVWLAVYTCNLFLNVFLFLGLRKRDRLAILIWFSLTLLWFLPKLYGHARGCRLDRRGATYQIVNLVMESTYLSLIIMNQINLFLLHTYFFDSLCDYIVYGHAVGLHLSTPTEEETDFGPKAYYDG